ncbi:alkyl sulfatase C-terminal domain-containing protein [Microbulbifer elongatus]|uniref:alkyl sulfatase C-terminal domain-containing protein n=1 Tax=Microbulbifer elongatus TaxID=86173 RepID=UPI001CFD882A|nr:alkyl sulfatase C-terminal domain-containing protein [Microbulbifer elongatus]
MSRYSPFALYSVLVKGVAPAAVGFGFHALEVSLDRMYPGSFPVAVALRWAADNGVIDASALAAPGKLKVEQGVTKGSIKLDGDAKKFEEFVSLLDTFDPWYQVVLPMGTK